MAEGYIIPKNALGNDLTPVETSTRVPLPIWAPGDGKTNRHHAHYYAHDFENGPLESRAVRFSRLQRVRKRPHKIMHDTFDGAMLPQSPEEAFVTTVLSCAGYIPDFVIELSGNTPEITETTPHHRAELQKPGVFSIERKRQHRAEVGQFLMNYAIWQDFDHVKKPLIDQYLSINKPWEQLLAAEEHKPKLLLGLRLIGKAIERAVSVINPEYVRARDESALRLGAPVCAWWVVKGYVSGHEPEYFDSLHERLALAYA